MTNKGSKKYLLVLLCVATILVAAGTAALAEEQDGDTVYAIALDKLPLYALLENLPEEASEKTQLTPSVLILDEAWNAGYRLEAVILTDAQGVRTEITKDPAGRDLTETEAVSKDGFRNIIPEQAVMPASDITVSARFVHLGSLSTWQCSTWKGLASALNAPEISEILLTCDIEYTAGDPEPMVPAGRTIALDLNGHTVDASPMCEDENIGIWYNLIMVKGELTLRDSKGNGAMIAKGGISMVAIDEEASFIMEGGSLVGSDFAHAAVYGLGLFNMKGGVIDTRDLGGCILFYEGGTFTMDGGEITNRNSQYSSIAIEGDFTMNGGSVTDLDGQACGILVDGSFTMNGGEILLSSTAADYCGLIAQNNGMITINDGSITVTNADYTGVLVTSGFSMSGGTITARDCYSCMWIEENFLCHIAGGRLLCENTKWGIIQGGYFDIGGNPQITGPVVLKEGRKIKISGQLGEDVLVTVRILQYPTETTPTVVTEGLPGYGTANHFEYGTFAFQIGLTDDGEAAVIAPRFGEPDFVLPSGTLTIADNAFEGADMSIVLIPDGCASIGAEAFRNCDRLTQIRVPGDCVIGADAFEGCGTVYIYSVAGSQAESYCDDYSNTVFVEMDRETD